MTALRFLAFVPVLVCAQSRFSLEGITEPIAQAVVGATVPGKVDAIPVREGQSVRKGDILLTLEREEEELSAQIARVVSQSKADLDGASRKEQLLGEDYKATKSIFDSSNSVSAEQLREKELQWRMAVAERDRLTAQEEREALEQRLAEAQVSRRIVRAPFNGVVSRIQKRPAESVQALEPLVEVVDVRRCRFVGHVPASEAQSLQVGQELSLQFDGSKAPRLRTGKIEFVSPVVDKASMLRTVKVVFENADGSIEPGVTGRIVRPAAP